MNRPHPQLAPGTWAPARRLAQRVLGPLDRFLHVEAASGIVLLIASVVALAWANSPWGGAYEHLWHVPITIGAGSLVFTQPLHFWINEGLMTIFFFVVGLEIRREMHEGELSDLKRAALPVAAAVGGMIAPALLYLALNASSVSRHGWGVPMATDIAFAVGVLALLGKRVPPALRVLLLALAIIDDIGAIIVIALFYSSGVAWTGLLIAGGGVLAVLVLQRFGVRRPVAYVAPGAVLWWGMLRAGIHPTIAGVVIGLLTPVRSWFGSHGFLKTARGVVDEVGALVGRDGYRADELLSPLRRIKTAQREALPPVVRLQAALHPWVAYGIMPLFAFANAGVRVDGSSLGHAASGAVLLGVMVGLVAGKPLGVFLASFAMVRLGVCALPRGVGWRGIAVVGCVAGIGFTMAIFIAGLAFDDAAMLAAAKLGVLLASTVAAVIGLLVGRLVLSGAPVPGAARTVEEAEASTEQ
ncbi:Na+/H+ antiporter NhaA [Sorangium sp. So ce291]|uniref:Na+/H+ antiporter NhaA n=1 Tax=Sorangium sp. So ce291 TaxID=3133294 RepID=UPI003F5DE61F